MFDFDESIENYGRGMVSGLLDKCTKGQQEFFKIVFPGGVDGLKDDQIKTAYDLLRIVYMFGDQAGE